MFVSFSQDNSKGKTISPPMSCWSDRRNSVLISTFFFQVAWIKSDSKAILAINTNMVALNPRLSVTYNNHNTWKLHISNVQANDSGTYMCQVNTDPMKSQVSLSEANFLVWISPCLTTNLPVLLASFYSRRQCLVVIAKMPSITSFISVQNLVFLLSLVLMKLL